MTDLQPTSTDVFAAVLFACALLHTFAARKIEHLSHRFPRHAGLWHLLGEVEVVFGFWAMLLVIGLAFLQGGSNALEYAESRNYTEPLFVLVVMVVAASRPILEAVRGATDAMAGWLPVRRSWATAWLGLALVPLFGSLITEPAAMTLAALMLAPQVFRPEVPERVKYFALGVLFVNVSIGGTLTSFAAPPVLMVASAWNWDSAFMARNFGWKAALAVVVNATLALLVLRRHLVDPEQGVAARTGVPWQLTLVHAACLAAVVFLSHHPVAFLAVFLLFLGVARAYERHQDPLVIREALLVAFFLAGLVVLGGLQAWWLRPIVESLSAAQLFIGATVLTAFTDNAALTYLGSLIEGLSEQARYALVAGAVAGGGLTVIANAPNPAGAALLRGGFEDGTIGAGGLALGALLPTAIALAAFWFL